MSRIQKSSNFDNFFKILKSNPINFIIDLINKKLKLKIVTKYVLKEFYSTFIIAFLFFFVIFFLNFVLLNIKDLLEKSIPLYLVLSLMVTFFPMQILLSLPFGTMLATLMVMGRFSSDNEIVAFRALGFNIMKIFTPIFISGLLITIATFLVNDRLIPISLQQQRLVMRKIMQIKPTMDFKSKTVKKHEDKIIFTNIVNDTTIQGLFIIDTDENNQKRIITAKDAEIKTSKDKPGMIELKMNNTMVQFESKDRPSEFNFGYADDISYFIFLQQFDESDPKNLTAYDKTTWENYKDVKLYRQSYQKEKKSIKQSYLKLKEESRNAEFMNEQALKDNISYNTYIDGIKKIDSNTPQLYSLKSKDVQNAALNNSLIEFYKKFSYPLACLIFAIFASPIGIYSRRAGYQIGFILGLFLTAFYWFSFNGAHILGWKFILSPFLAMALPNLFFLIIGIIFLFKRLKE